MSATDKPRTRRKRGPRGMGSFYLKRGVWYIAFTHAGVRHTMSTGSRVKGDAVRFRERVHAEKQMGRYAGGSAKVTLADMKAVVLADHDANGLRSKKRAEQGFATLERLLGAKKRVEHLAPALPGYIQKRLAETIGPTEDADGNAIEARHIARGTVNRELGYLRRGFHLLVRQGRLAVMPHVALLKEDNVRKRRPTKDEVEAVMKQLPEGLREAMRLLSIIPWRVREALDLCWRQVDPKEGEIRHEATEYKSGRAARVLPYAQYPVLIEIIGERRRVTDAWQRDHGQIVEYVFWHEGEDEHGRVVALPYAEYSGTWERACKRAKVADFHVHDLKRYSTDELTKAGVDELTIMRLAGWRSRSMFDRYSIRNNQDLANGIRKLAAYAAIEATRPHASSTK